MHRALSAKLHEYLTGDPIALVHDSQIGPEWIYRVARVSPADRFRLELENNHVVGAHEECVKVGVNFNGSQHIFWCMLGAGESVVYGEGDEDGIILPIQIRDWMDGYVIDIFFYRRGLPPRVAGLERQFLTGRRAVPFELLMRYTYHLLPREEDDLLRTIGGTD